MKAKIKTKTTKAKKTTKQQDIVKLINLLNITEAFMASIKAATSQENSKMVTALMEALMDLIIKENALDLLKQKIAIVYDETYTEAEVKALLKFYDSKLGKKVLSCITTVTTRSVDISKEWMNEFMITTPKRNG